MAQSNCIIKMEQIDIHGEGIGDALNPNSRIRVVRQIDLDSDGHDLNDNFMLLNHMLVLMLAEDYQSVLG